MSSRKGPGGQLRPYGSECEGGNATIQEDVEKEYCLDGTPILRNKSAAGGDQPASPRDEEGEKKRKKVKLETAPGQPSLHGMGKRSQGGLKGPKDGGPAGDGRPLKYAHQRLGEDHKGSEGGKIKPAYSTSLL